MSDLAYFEYALVLPEERYLNEVQTRNLATGETRGNDELQKRRQRGHDNSHWPST
jgi:hypothetical protein